MNSRPIDRRIAIARHVLVSFALGATVGVGFDAFHTHSGTTRYAHVWFAQMDWWVPLLFGTTGVIALGAYPLLEARFGRATRVAASRAHILGGVVAFAALYATSAYLPASNVIKLVVIGLAAAALCALLCRTAASLAVAAIAAIGGVLVESTLVRFGAFWYTSPDPAIAGVPIWLPALYAAGAFTLGPAGARMWAGARTVEGTGAGAHDADPRQVRDAHVA